MSATTSSEVVLDASAAVRGLDGASPLAIEIANRVVEGESVAHAPDLIVCEVTNALRARTDDERQSLEEALDQLETFLDWPVALQSSGPLASASLVLAAELGLSAYDAFYAVLAATLEVPLVTADRKLAAAVPGAVLVS